MQTLSPAMYSAYNGMGNEFLGGMVYGLTGVDLMEDFETCMTPVSSLMHHSTAMITDIMDGKWSSSTAMGASVVAELEVALAGCPLKG